MKKVSAKRRMMAELKGFLRVATVVFSIDVAIPVVHQHNY
jgi:hypothetical protein